MKKIIIACVVALLGSVNAFAQKYALIDMDYILKQIPQYEMANEQLNQISKRWQAEVETLAAEAEQMYKQYEADMVYLTQEQKIQRENDILAKEKEVQDLRLKYFGPKRLPRRTVSRWSSTVLRPKASSMQAPRSISRRRYCRRWDTKEWFEKFKGFERFE